MGWIHASGIDNCGSSGKGLSQTAVAGARLSVPDASANVSSFQNQRSLRLAASLSQLAPLETMRADGERRAESPRRPACGSARPSSALRRRGPTCAAVELLPADCGHCRTAPTFLWRI